MDHKASLASLILCLPLLACSAPPPTEEAPASTPLMRSDNVRSLPVPFGQQLSCGQLLSSSAMEEQVGQSVLLSSASFEDESITARCDVLSAQAEGEPSPQELGARERVAAGETMCEIEIQCSYFYDAAELQDECRDTGGALSVAGDASICTRSFRRGRTTFAALDPETSCLVTARSGLRVPEAMSAQLTDQCGRAALDSLDSDSLRAQAPSVAAITR